MSIAFNAAIASLNASDNAFTPSPLNPYRVAAAVGREAAERATQAHVARDLAERREAQAVKHTPALLGCWVNGKLRFQSRDHEAIHGYARAHMEGAKNFGNDVWVAPVGSFVDTGSAAADDTRKMRRVKKGARRG